MKTGPRHRRPQGHDGPTYSASLWQGFALPNDGFLTVTGEYSYRNPTNRADLDPRVTPNKVTGVYGDPQIETKTIYANFGLPLNEAWKPVRPGRLSEPQGRERGLPAPGRQRQQLHLRSIPTATSRRSRPTSTTTTWPSAPRAWSPASTVDASVNYGNNKVEYGTINSINASLGPASPTRFKDGSMQYGQTVAALDFTRPLELFSFAKPSTLAFGIEYRDESYKIKAGETASWVNGGNGKGAGAQGFPGFRPTNAVDVSRHSTSLYVDLDNQITDKLDVDLAVRYEDYSDFGSTTTGKIAARYDLTDSFAMRGAYSTGFRAPALQQQYFTTTSINIVGGAAVDVGTFPATSATAQVLGAKPLEPEKSKNYSLGAVFHKGPFELTVDAYQIDIDNRIVLSENIAGANDGHADPGGYLQPAAAVRRDHGPLLRQRRRHHHQGRRHRGPLSPGRRRGWPLRLYPGGQLQRHRRREGADHQHPVGLPVPPPLFARVNVADLRGRHAGPEVRG
jgi:iron complex outermembrane receptor protein